jgi:hypothetical protein
MSYWVGRFIHTDDGEHGRVLDRKVLRRLRKRQLVELIEAKDVELVAWDEGERLELVADEYLADEGTHVSLSASDEAARPPRRPRTLFPVAVVVTFLALCAAGLVLARVQFQASRLAAVRVHSPARAGSSAGTTVTPGLAPRPSPARSLNLAPYPFPTVTRMSPSLMAVPSMTTSPSPIRTTVTTTTSVASPWPGPTDPPSSSPAPTPPPTTPAPTPDPG